jgi:hypothetical protein
MDPIKRRVDALIQNAGTRWTEDDRHMLEGQSEAFLIRLEHQPQASVETPLRPPETMSEAIATLPQHLQEPMHAMAAEYEARKARSIALLAAEPACPFAAEELQAMTAQRLEQLVRMAGKAVEPQPAPMAYMGQGMPYIRPLTPEEQVPAPRDTLKLVVERQKELGLLH